jgi:hypothetical protein
VRKINLNDFKTADHRILRDINEVIVLNIIHVRPCLMGAIALVLAQNFAAPKTV